MGLGKDGKGIVNPIDVKLRPMGAGLGMVDEKTEAVKKEQSKHKPQSMGGDQGKAPSNRWKKVGIKKRKPLYKTASEIIQQELEVGVAPVVAAPISTKIRDLRGEEEQVFSNMSEMTSAQLLTSEQLKQERLPELRHNLKLLADSSQKDLVFISRQLKIEQESRKERFEQGQKSSILVLEEKNQLERVKVVHSLVQDIKRISAIHGKELVSEKVDPDIIQQLFGPLLDQLINDYPHEFKTFKLSHLVCQIIGCVVKARIKLWDPLAEPLLFSTLFSFWARRLKICDSDDLSSTGHKKKSQREEMEVGMKPLDCILYTIWLPKLRQAIKYATLYQSNFGHSNNWDPKEPDNLIELLSFYSSKSNPILPPWLLYNITYQLILPKLENALQDHKISISKSDGRIQGHKIHTWLFPWLPVLGPEALEPVWKTSRRKFQLAFREWSPTDEAGLEITKLWSQVWDSSDLEAFITTCILPRLVYHLRHSFSINPSNQDIQPLLRVFEWKSFVQSHLLSHLLHTEFFPGWTQCLWKWITSPQANLDEISQWYTTWKGLFSQYNLESLEAVKEGFRTGLDMMNQGVSRSISATSSFVPTISSKAATSSTKTMVQSDEKLTFHDIVSSIFAESSLEFVPTGKVHSATGKQVYRLGNSDGKRILVYIDDGVLFCSSTGLNGHFAFKSIEDVIQMVS